MRKKNPQKCHKGKNNTKVGDENEDDEKEDPEKYNKGENAITKVRKSK